MAIIFKNWLIHSHSLEFPGWLWIIALLLTSGLPAFILYRRDRKKRLLTGEKKEEGDTNLISDPQDIQNQLKQWLTETAHEYISKKIYSFTIRYDDIDSELGLSHGSTKENITLVVFAHSTYDSSISSKNNYGEKTAQIYIPSPSHQKAAILRKLSEP